MEALRAVPEMASRPAVLHLHREQEASCEGKVRACHFDPFGDKGMGTKVSDSASLADVRRRTMPSRRTFSAGLTSRANTASTGATS
jgi:hypothetical protein